MKTFSILCLAFALTFGGLVGQAQAQSPFPGSGPSPLPPPIVSNLDLTGNWINYAGNVEPLFHLPLRTFSLQMTAPATFMVPGLDTRARVLIVNNEPRYISHSGAQLATGLVQRDASGAVVSIRWSCGSTWVRSR